MAMPIPLSWRPAHPGEAGMTTLRALPAAALPTWRDLT